MRSSVWNVSIARGIEQMDRLRFEAIAPTFLLAVTKTGVDRMISWSVRMKSSGSSR